MDWLKAAANRSQSQPAKPRSSRRAPTTPTQPQPSHSNDDLPSTNSNSSNPRAARLQALQSLSQQLHQLKHDFHPPPSLSFQPTATATSPKLDFSASNRPVLAFEEALVKLMIQLDSVESEGDVKVREERKKLVNRVDAELAKVDQLKREAWENGGVVLQVQEEEQVGGKEDKLREQKQKVDRMLKTAGWSSFSLRRSLGVLTPSLSSGASPIDLNRASQNSNGKRVDQCMFPSGLTSLFYSAELTPPHSPHPTLPHLPTRPQPQSSTSPRASPHAYLPAAAPSFQRSRSVLPLLLASSGFR